MLDPITAFTAASAAFSGIKKAISVGKDITSMGSTLSQWSKAVADIDFLEQKAKKPPMYKMFTDTQASALDIWTKKQKLKEMREELRSHISWTYGPSAWDEIVAIEAQQRKAQRDAVYAKEEMRQKIIDAILAVLILSTAVGILALVVYYIGRGQGKW
jgi:hypothetical protein|tara:strand:- start:211 stop:684 length:474 start_codon:yes stop_codon:yes gene_type:complete